VRQRDATRRQEARLWGCGRYWRPRNSSTVSQLRPHKGRTLASTLLSSSQMHPFTQEKRRKINLGGATSVASQTDILHSAKARRNEREEIRRRHESALCIQSHWRSFQQYRVVRQRLSHIFQEDVLALNGMRALVLIGSDDVLLAQWSEAVIRAGDGEHPVSIAFPSRPSVQTSWSRPFLSLHS
jgi:hypothetical protein